MTVCEHVAIGIDWQYDNNTWENELDRSTKSPLEAMSYSGFLNRRYDTSTQTMVSAGEGDQNLMNNLCFGQSHNPPAQLQYRQCCAEMGLYPFFRMVVSAAPGTPSNFAEAIINIEWQRRARYSTIPDATSRWQVAQSVNDPNSKDFFMTCAMVYLMYGQHHNRNAMKLYRACFRDDPNQLFNIVLANLT